MIGTTAAILGASLIGAGASAASSNKAAKTAANAAAQSAAQNNALQREIYDKNTTNLTPYMEQGKAANTQIAGLLNLGGDPAASQNAFQKYLDSSGYQFNLKSGSDAVAQQALGTTGLHSGAALKGLTKYGQNLGSNYFGTYLNQLGGQQQVGLSGANALAGVGTNYAGAVSANNDSAASATGNAALAGAANLNSTIGAGLNAFGTYAGMSSYGKKV